MKILTAACAGTLIYVAASLTGGQYGYMAVRQLEEQKRLISTRKAEIQDINDSLSMEVKSLSDDPDVIAAYARKLGYISDGEKLVKINGLPPVEEQVYDTGSVLRKSEMFFLPEWFCKVLGLIVGVLVFLILLIQDSRKKITYRKRQYTTVSGLPVYDLRQI